MTPDEPVRLRSPAWMKLLLILSLTANLVVIGVVAGHALRHDKRRDGQHRAVEWILRLVPEDRRALAEAHFAEAQAALEAADDAGPQVAAILAAIRAEPYDPSAVEVAMAGYGSVRAERWAVLRERIATLLAQLTPEERVGFADRLQERMERWRERRRD